MRLKRLTCRGFKSFADKTEFDFDATLTGIVGPNGCGKSNVVDALKWVLGDQRARSLRGKEMTDVIFKGAEGRDAMAIAEVEITLEDVDGAADGRTEMTIGRRLNIDKESDYLINGEVCRLKDVRIAMMDTGLGVGAYSVMEQGRIDAVLSADPESRRAIFEEAAGISRFKQQKRETLRRLDRTEQNLARVQDLMEERGKRIRSLKVQASRARRYVELRDQLRDHRAALAVTEARVVRADQSDRERALADCQQEQRVAETARVEAAAELEQIEQRIRARGSAVAEVDERLHVCRGQVDAAQTRAASLQERAAEQLADAGAARQRRDGFTEQQRTRQAALADERQRLDDLSVEQERLRLELDERHRGLAECEAAVRGVEADREQARARLLESIHRKTLVRNRAHGEEAQIRALRGRDDRLGERLAVLAEDRGAVAAEHAECGAARAALEQQLLVVRAEEQQVIGALEVADREAAELAVQESALREDLSSVGGRLQILAEMEQDMEGLDRGPRHLLQQQATGLRGRLLDLLDVDLEHGAALEAALGPLVQALVVDTRDHADAMRAALVAGQHGRAVLLVEEEFSHDLEREPVRDLPDGARLLVDFVRCGSHARGLLQWLLRGACLVDSLDRAHPDRHDLCFVTRDGDLLCGPRLEGGRAESQGGLVVRKAQMQSLRAEEAALRARLDELLRGKQVVAGRVSRLRDEASALAARSQELRDAELARGGDLRRLEGRQQDLEREAETLGLERREVRQHGSAARAQLGVHLLDIHLVGRLEVREAAAEQAAADALAAAQARAQEARVAEQDLRLREVACATDREALQGTIVVHEQGLADLAQAAEELASREAAARATAERARHEAEQCAEEADARARELAELEAERDTCRGALAEVEQEREQHRARLAELEQRRVEVGEQINALRLELADLEHRFARIDDRLREDTSLELRRSLGEVGGLGMVERRLPGPSPAADTVEQLQGPPLPPALVHAQLALNRLWEAPDFDLAETQRLAQVLQSKVDRLGHVNLDAVQELEDMESSFVFLEQEIADLRESRGSLIETLRRLETESRALFERTFEAARINFQAIFRKLFQGGKADMVLTEGEDSLEAGIEIVARPPGKELQSINLLSGGERSLTALAILFAVFKVKPSPFCILDEVDAALDDTNVERFLRVLREFVGPTQFCVVTHHKRTMAECQKLYGITMQRRGVSSRLAVSLDEVDQVVAVGAGEGPGARRGQRSGPGIVVREPAVPDGGSRPEAKVESVADADS